MNTYRMLESNFYTISSQETNMSRRSTLSTKPKPSHAYNSGRQVGQSGLSRHSNPYRRGTKEWYSWDKGWLEGSDKYLKGWDQLRIYK